MILINRGKTYFKTPKRVGNIYFLYDSDQEKVIKMVINIGKKMDIKKPMVIIQKVHKGTFWTYQEMYGLINIQKNEFVKKLEKTLKIIKAC